MKRMRITVKKAISTFLLMQCMLLAVYFFSPIAFANVEVAFLSAFFVIIGSSYAYKKIVQAKVALGEYEEKRDLLDEIEDPHGLYDDEEINEAPAEELDLKKIIKEEKSKVKVLNLKNIKYGTKGSASAFRLVPYVFLILGFIALKNNEVLDLVYYLPSLAVGIVTGSLVAKEIAS